MPDNVPSFEDYVKNYSVDGNSVFYIIEGNRHKFEKVSEQLEMAFKDIQEGNIQKDAWATITQEAEVERLECLMEKEVQIVNEPEQIPELQSENKLEKHTPAFHHEAPTLSHK